MIEMQILNQLATLNQEEKREFIAVLNYLKDPDVFEIPESYKEFLEWKKKNQ